ncbi:MAG: hypothetical protein EPN26_15055 [Rhodospirillales bacterium]|nr:MAG: hypothetical protein EPN26_15055 [Rhodospirillales bacterium]
MPGVFMLDGLTPRQREIVSLIEQGRSNKEIAALLDIGVGTVKQHVAALFRRLNVTSRAQAVAALRGLSTTEGREEPAFSRAAPPKSPLPVQETSALGAECRVVSVAVITMEAIENVAQSMGTRYLVEHLEALTRLGRQAADALEGQCFERAGQGIELRFGLTRARVNDAARAVQAARYVLERLAAEDGGNLKPRGGIASGVAVVMAQIGQPARPLACAELAHAWRLAHAAPPGRLLACEATQRLTSDIIGFDPPSPGSAQGRAALVRGDLAPHAPSVLAPPRQAALDRAITLLADKRCISIEASTGLGRTSMAASLAKRIEAAGGTTLYIPALRRGPGGEAACLTTALEMKLGLSIMDDAAERNARLKAYLSGLGVTDPPVFKTLSALLSHEPTPLSAQELASALSGLTAEHRLTVLVDDAESAMPLLVEILAKLSASPDLPINLVLFGTNLQESLTRRLSVLEQMKMPPLDDEDMAAVIGVLDPEKHLDDALTRAVIRQAQGRPGDGVELVIALLARIRTKGDGASPQGLPMPLRLYAGLIGEMDQDPDLREALRLAALLGRFFAPGLLARFWPRGQKALDDALARAVASKLLVPEGSGASARFTFARPLLREAAVLSWLTADRTRLRARIERTRVRVGSVALAPAGHAAISKTPLKELAEL